MFSGEWQQVASNWLLVSQLNINQTIIKYVTLPPIRYRRQIRLPLTPSAARQFIRPSNGRILFAKWQIASCVLSNSFHLSLLKTACPQGGKATPKSLLFNNGSREDCG
jgi:hypothetical protein